MSATRLRSEKHLSEREPLQKVTKKEASNLEEEPAKIFENGPQRTN